MKDMAMSAAQTGHGLVALNLTDALDNVDSASEAVQALRTLLEVLQCDTELDETPPDLKFRAAALACAGQLLCDRAADFLAGGRHELVAMGAQATATR